MSIELFLSILSLVCVTVIGFLQWRTQSQSAKASDARDWSSTARDLRAEIDDLKKDMKSLWDENRVLKELARRLIKRIAETGEPIILSPLEESLIFDTGQRIKAGKK